jgi:hypothetical protein
VEFNDTQEFCRAIDSAAEAAEAAAEAEKAKKKAGGSTRRNGAGATAMDVDDDGKLDFEREEAEDGQMLPPPPPRPTPSQHAEAAGVAAEAVVGRGLAGVLAHLKNSGTLDSHQTISGRTNDKKKGKLATAWDESDIPKVSASVGVGFVIARAQALASTTAIACLVLHARWAIVGHAGCDVRTKECARRCE